MSTSAERAEVYLTRRWQRLRLAVLKNANWLCQCPDCRKHGLTKQADMVHHVERWQAATGDRRQELAFSRANLVAVSRDCHARLHKEDAKPPQSRAWAKAVHSLLEGTA